MSYSVYKTLFQRSTLFALFSMVFSLSAANAAPPLKPGLYCPGVNIQLIIAEDLSSSLAFVMQSRLALSKDNKAEATRSLIAAGVTLQQALSRGAGARTGQLINSIILARANADNKQLLTWFPLLHTALLGLPVDDASTAAIHAVDNAEEILQSDSKGDPMGKLAEAQHFLVCDDFYLPLQDAIKEQKRISKLLESRQKTQAKDYDKLLSALRTAIIYVQKNSQL